MSEAIYRLRSSQEDILSYSGGRMGISAVPGSGKTWTLSLLAAQLIGSGVLADGQEVLVVTLVNSAVDNFYQRIGGFVRRYNLIPNMGYRVRTLHGLAHDIVRERPSLVGLDDNFQIMDERDAEEIRDEIAVYWLKNHPEFVDAYIKSDLDEGKLQQIRRLDLPELVKNIAADFIRYAKDQQLTPEKLRLRLDQLPIPLPLAELGWDIYVEYQRALNYRGAVDFDDLIRLALAALQGDGDYLARLQNRWPYILEDEAQDSSRLQEEILRRLTGTNGNWVRVGDPNQAIYETFTTANPRYLRDFMGEQGVNSKTLPESGRSTESIIKLANYLVNWVQNEHPVPEVRDALYAPPEIKLTLPGDPQPNPPDDPDGIHLVWRKFSPQDEIKAVADSLARYLPDHPEATIAVLAPRNQRGFDLTKELDRREIPYEDGLLRSSSSTRLSVGVLTDLLNCLADPQSPRKLAKVFEAWWKRKEALEGSSPLARRISELIRKVTHVEDYLWPGPASDWLDELSRAGVDPMILETLNEFRNLVRRWQAATLLPVDQIILTVSQDLLVEPVELAVSHKIAILLRSARQLRPESSLADLTKELETIARNERRFLGFSQDEVGFDPNKYRGRVVLGTIHKAKGLEWDRVYLMSVNNYDFPSGQEGDKYLPEKWYLRDGLNLEAETLAQLKTALSNNPYEWYEPGIATQQARSDYVRERLRLLYVGITRARKELIITWNTGRSGDQEPAIALAALSGRLDVK